MKILYFILESKWLNSCITITISPNGAKLARILHVYNKNNKNNKQEQQTSLLPIQTRIFGVE